MANHGGKQQIHQIDGTPQKRLFLSIISDYDLRTGLCELIDNAIDLWVTNGKKNDFEIRLNLDAQRQLISVADNAGGVKEAQLHLLVAPGATGNTNGREIIGIFGVGGKRAGIALGEQVEIRTRYKKERSLQIDINNEWLQSDSWHLAAYQIPEITPSTTVIDISKLRQTFTEDDIDFMYSHLGETYAWFLHEGCKLLLNDVEITPLTFSVWAYPPDYEPRTSEFSISVSGNEKLHVTMTAGLINDRDPESENYGVYFYCNHRLVVKELRTRDVGYFVTSEAGVPHPDASLCRVIVEFQGAGSLMPWNSSKSGINYSHPAFVQLRPSLINLVSYFTSLSRRLKTDWGNQVFRYKTGKAEVLSENEVLSKRKIVLPTLPRIRKLPRIEEIK